MEIIPAVMPRNYEDLKNKIAMVRGLVPTVQIDLMDRRFTNGITWPFSKNNDEEVFSSDPYFLEIIREENGLPFWEEIDFELDLMVRDAIENFDNYLKLGPKRIVFHLEAQDPVHLREFIEGIDLYVRDNVSIGVAINTTTPISEITPLLFCIDFVQCMGIEHIGFQGEPFDERVIDNIKALRKDHPELIISVDGGVNLDTAPMLIEAGANRLVIGSAIFGSIDIRETVREFENNLKY